jgi:hypothetical protein
MELKSLASNATPFFWKLKAIVNHLKELEKALKEVLLSKPTDKAKYENKKPSKFEKNQKWRLDERI